MIQMEKKIAEGNIQDTIYVNLKSQNVLRYKNVLLTSIYVKV